MVTSIGDNLEQRWTDGRTAFNFDTGTVILTFNYDRDLEVTLMRDLDLQSRNVDLDL